MDGPSGTYRFVGGSLKDQSTGGVNYYGGVLYDANGNPIPIGSFRQLNEIIIYI